MSVAVNDPGTVPTVRVSAELHEPVIGADINAFHELPGTDLFTTWDTARTILKHAASPGRENFDGLLRDPRVRITTGGNRPVAIDDAVSVFGTTDGFLQALRSLRTTVNGRALAAGLTVNGVTLDMVQAMHVSDGLWRREPSAADAHRLMLEAGTDPGDADRAVGRFPDLLAALNGFAPGVAKSGVCIFSYRERELRGEFLTIDRGLSVGAVIPTICWKLFAWGAAHGTLESWTMRTNFTERNYGFALCGYDFDPERYPSRRTVVTDTIRAVMQTARTDSEQELAAALLLRAETEPEDSYDYPNLHDIASLGRGDGGGGDWLGRRGLAAVEHGFDLRFRYEPGRAYRLAYGRDGTVAKAGEEQLKFLRPVH